MAENLLSPSNGLSNSKLTKTTAAVSDVVSGKTFYSGNKTLKTGTLNLAGDTAAVSDVLSGKTFHSGNTTTKTGTMTNRGTWNGTYSGTNVTIPQGYHSGSGVVSVSGGNRGAWGTTINPGGSVTIPQGYHNGSGVVKANPASASIKVESARTTQWIGQSPWSKTFAGQIITAGISSVDEDGGGIYVTVNGNVMTVNNSRQDDTPVTFTYTCAYYT